MALAFPDAGVFYFSYVLPYNNHMSNLLNGLTPEQRQAMYQSLFDKHNANDEEWGGSKDRLYSSLGDILYENGPIAAEGYENDDSPAIEREFADFVHERGWRPEKSAASELFGRELPTEHFGNARVDRIGDKWRASYDNKGTRSQWDSVGEYDNREDAVNKAKSMK